MSRGRGSIVLAGTLLLSGFTVACSASSDSVTPDTTPATASGSATASATSAASATTAASASVPEASVHYYKGKVTTTSPDGKTPYGPPTDTVVRRAVDPNAGTIVEDVVSAGSEYPTTMRRIGETSAFEASDGTTFSGTLNFAGPEWQWDSWTYALAMSDKSGTITGTGRIENGTITTEKLFTPPNGKPSARIVDSLAPSSAEEFEREKARLLALPKPSRR